MTVAVVLLVGGDERARALLASASRSVAAIVEADSSAAVDRWLLESDAPDAIVIAPDVSDPIRLTQRAHALRRDTAIVLLVESSRLAAVARAIQFAPLIGSDVRAQDLEMPNAAEALRRVLENAVGRRAMRAALSVANERVSGAMPGALRSPEYLERLLDRAPIGIIALDDAGRILAWNPRAGILLDTPEREALGGSLAQFFPPHESERLGNLLSGDGDEVTMVVQRYSKGAPQHLEVTTTTLSSRGPGRSLVLMQDVTGRVLAERTRDEFLAVAAHELKTPVAAVKGSAQLLLRAKLGGRLDDERLSKGLRSIVLAAGRLAVLTDDMLDLARMRVDRLPLRPVPTDVAALLRALVAERLERLPDGHRLVLRVEAEPCVLSIDPSRIEQVVNNLLDNAVKYAPGGGTIEVVLRREGAGFALTVRDEGIGLSPGTEELIFERFGRSPNAVAHHLPGFGLGLHLSRDIVNRHRGRIWAESPGEDRGTTMTVWLPERATYETDRPI